jgi:hypothetical protein
MAAGSFLGLGWLGDRTSSPTRLAAVGASDLATSPSGRSGWDADFASLGPTLRPAAQSDGPAILDAAAWREAMQASAKYNAPALHSPGSDARHLTSQAIPARQTGQYLTCPIRDLPVAVWILADNPETEGNAGIDFSRLDPSALCILRLRMVKPDGSLLHIQRLELVASPDLDQIAVGSSLHVEYEELGISGDAAVVEVLPCPRIPPRPSPRHCLVTSTFAHDAANVVDVYVDGLAEPIGVTTNHAIWSADRRKFVQAGNLKLGETLVTADGTMMHVRDVAPRCSAEPVYNLEVDHEHVYHVSSRGVLVHNAGEKYNQQLGQTVYALINTDGIVRYIGRGNGPARELAHAATQGRSTFDFAPLMQRLGKRQAKGLEQALMDHFGGARSQGGRQLQNLIRSYRESNKKRGIYKRYGDGLLAAALKALSEFLD